MTTPKKQDREPIIPGEPIKQDIQDSLRQILETNREISLGDYGEGPKSISVKHDKKTYKFYQDSGRDGSGWVMEITDDEGNYEDTVDVVEKSDIEYLEKIFGQDISDSMRHALEESRDISYEDYGGKKVVSVKYGGKMYKFYRANNEYADWAMEVEDEKGEWLGTTDVREKSDVDYLERLFETPTKDEQIQNIKDRI